MLLTERVKKNRKTATMKLCLQSQKLYEIRQDHWINSTIRMLTPYLFVSPDLKILLSSQGLFYYMRVGCTFFQKRSNMNSKKDKAREKLSKNREKHTKNRKNFDTFGKRHLIGCNYQT